MGFPSKTSTADLARLLGLSPRRIQQLADDGVLPRVSHGLFESAASVKAYIAFACRAAVEERGRYAGLPKERAALVRVQRELAEMERDRIRGMTVMVEDVATEVAAVFAGVRNLFLGLAAKLAPRVIHCGTATEAQSLIQTEVEAILRELSAEPDEAEVDDAA